MVPAILYARVSSREQEREGYSIPAQRKLLAAYARLHELDIRHEFIDVESAKNPGRKEFGKMLRLLETDQSIRVVLVEKTDRLYRNRADALSFEELIETRGVEVHLVKEARVIGKNSRSQDKFMHDIHVAVAKHYVENLRDEVKKGMREKAEQGFYPGRAPFGYRNNRLTPAVDVDETKASVLKRMFELYATGDYSLTTLKRAIFEQFGVRIPRSYLETVLKSSFYIGQFVWRGVIYNGKHTPLISRDLYQRVQEAFAGRNKPKYRKHNFAFAGLMRCSHDGCTVTTELQKGRYIYYRCSHGRGKCSLPYMREQDVAIRLGEVLKQIYVPEGIASQIVETLATDSDRLAGDRSSVTASIQKHLAAVRTRMDRIYEDKLDGKISDDFWNRKQSECRDRERALQLQIERSEPRDQSQILTVKKIFELASSAYSLYLTRNSTEQGQLLKSVLLNCDTDGVNIWPVYKKPFDLIFERAKSEDWSGREDLNLRPPWSRKRNSGVVLNVFNLLEWCFDHLSPAQSPSQTVCDSAPRSCA
jgi:DNA invertase Pin-like site-specific DNA recombinase